MWSFGSATEGGFRDGGTSFLIQGPMKRNGMQVGVDLEVKVKICSL
jgi:hypothetical protein